jgi:hypothetical protein
VKGMLSNPVMNEWRYRPVTDYWQTVGPIGSFMWRTDAYDPAAAWTAWAYDEPGLAPSSP